MRAGNHIELRLGHVRIVWQPPTTRAAALPDNRPMLLAVDIGNTQTHVGAFDGEKLAHDWRLGTDPTVTSDELAATLGNLLELEGMGFDGIDAASWTNPPLTTVEQPIDEIARTAVAALRSQVERPSERQPSYVFRPRLRLGGTTAPPASASATS